MAREGRPRQNATEKYIVHWPHHKSCSYVARDNVTTRDGPAARINDALLLSVKQNVACVYGKRVPRTANHEILLPDCMSV